MKQGRTTSGFHINWIMKDNFDVPHNVSNEVNLVQLMETIGNFSHTITVYGV